MTKRKNSPHSPTTKVLDNSIKSYLFTFGLLFLGSFIAALMLHTNQNVSGTLSIASLLSPTGGRVKILGFRVKHWMVGTLLSISAIFFYVSTIKLPYLKPFSVITLGAGLTLVADELDELP